MSAFWGSLGLALLYLLIVRIFAKCHCEDPAEGGKRSNLDVKTEIASPTVRNDNGETSPLSNFILIASAVSGVLGLGFASAFWFQTIRAEVYTLNFFFTVLILYLLVKWAESFEFRIIALACFIYGLSFTNHSFLMATLFPAFIVFVAITNSKEAFNLKRLPFLFGLFLLAITIYLFLLIRANQWPAIDSGAPDSWKGLFGSMTRSSDLSSLVQPNAYENRFWFCLSFPVYQFSLIFFGWGILGAVRLIRANWKLGVLLLLVFILNVLTATWAANFTLLNKDILGYLIPSLVVFTIFISFGFFYTSFWLVHLLRKRSTILANWLGYVFITIFILFPILQLTRNIKECNQSKNLQPYQFGKEILGCLKQNALIIPTSDYTLHTFWYLVYAEKQRPDIKIISVGMKRHKSYIREVRRQYPDIKLPANAEEVRELASGEQFLSDLCELNVEQMPVYYDYFYGEESFLKHFWPNGFLLEYKPDEVDIPDSIAEKHYSYLKNYFDLHKIDKAEPEAQTFFSSFMFNMGVFYGKVGKGQYCDKFIDFSFDLCPHNPSLYCALGRNLMDQKDFNRALVFLQAATESDPYDEDIYYSLAHCYFELKDYSKTREMLVKASEINPHNNEFKRRIKELEALIRKGQNEKH